MLGYMPRSHLTMLVHAARVRYFLTCPGCGYLLLPMPQQQHQHRVSWDLIRSVGEAEGDPDPSLTKTLTVGSGEDLQEERSQQ